MQMNYAITPAIISVIKVRDEKSSRASRPVSRTAPRGAVEGRNLLGAVGAQKSEGRLGSAGHREGSGDKEGVAQTTAPLPDPGGEQSPALARQVPDADLWSVLSRAGPRPLSQTFIVSSRSGLETTMSPSAVHRVDPEDLAEPL